MKTKGKRSEKTTEVGLRKVANKLYLERVSAALNWLDAIIGQTKCKGNLLSLTPGGRNPYLRGMDYFGQLSALLKKEREADKRSYLDLMRGTSVSNRRAAGLAWYPVAIRGTEPGRGDYLIVEVERTTHKDLPHQLRFGSAALLFSGENSVEGVISYQGADRLKLTLRTEDLPDWVDDGKLGIDLLFDDNSYDEMFGAMRRAAALEDNRLVRVLTGGEEPRFTPVAFEAAASLNPTQVAAVRKILGAEDIAIVHGPPGTGKTTTLVQAIKALIQQEPQRVLVTAPSNTAVDLLSERLAAEGLYVLRIGNPARVSDRLVALTLDERTARHPASKEIRGLRRRATEFRDMAHKYKRSFGPAEREQRKALFGEARKIMKEVEQIEKYILDDLLDKAQVIAATLVGAAHYTIRDLTYRTAFIDEAAQALEPACWIPAVKAGTLVLAGDHFQLPPVIKSEEAGPANKSGNVGPTNKSGNVDPANKSGNAGLAETLMEKLVRRYPGAVTLLEEQYRMHPVIMGFPSKIFYENRLIAAPSVPDGEDPLLFIDTAGCGFEEKQEGNGLSNPEEGAFLAKYLAQFPPEGSVAVISPYRLQVELLKELIHQEGVTVNTIDAFQGQERDVVYISMTRSNTDNRIGFLSEIRRMNVAMTRARRHLVVIGDGATLSQSPFYADFIAYAEARGGYKSAWEFIQ